MHISTPCRRSFNLFRLLLQYHDPKLCQFLDQYSLRPETYATPWVPPLPLPPLLIRKFITLFARSTDPPVLYRIWDLFFASNDPFEIYFVGLALLSRWRERLFAMGAEHVPEVLCGLIFTVRQCFPQSPFAFQRPLVMLELIHPPPPSPFRRWRRPSAPLRSST
jgi:hypothetical protein